MLITRAQRLMKTRKKHINMEKKVVLSPEDFDKIVRYVTNIPVHFNTAVMAVEMQEIFKRVKLMNITENNLLPKKDE
jgi:hypothetical protein